MAGKITHIEALTQTIKHLSHGDSEQRKIADLLYNPYYRKYANVGTVAPDIFYYYDFLSPVRTTKAQFWGDLHHHQNVAELVLNFLDLCIEIEEDTLRDKFLAFIFGYICHCAVDVVTHPYIFYISGDYYNKDPKVASIAQMNHLKVEYALDSYILYQRWGLTPKTYDFLQYVDITKKNSPNRKIDPMIWMLWQSALELTFPEEFRKHYIGSNRKIIPGDVINESYLGFLDFNRLLDSRSTIMRGFLRFVDRITFQKFQSSILMLPMTETIDKRILNEEKSTWRYPAEPKRTSNESFIELIHRACSAAKEVITLGWLYFNKEVKREKILSTYSGYNLDTGLRNKTIEKMKEFSPLVG